MTPSFSLRLCLLTIFIVAISADCPIQYYPRQTIIGYINAQINNSQEKHNQEQSYIFNMDKHLSTSTPNVVTGVNSIEYNMNSQLRFNVAYQPTPRFGTLNFKVLVSDPSFKWRRIQFNFIATNNQHLAANTIQFEAVNLNTENTHSLVSNINIGSSFQTNPIIYTYISGINAKAKMSQTDFESALKQIQTLKRFSWNVNLVRTLNTMMQTQSQLYFEIKQSTLKNNSLTIQLTISDSVIIDSISISYLIINSVEFPLQNNLVHNSFSLSEETRSFNFKPLQLTDLTFIGLNGLKHFINSPIDLQFTLRPTRGQFSVLLTQQLSKGYSIFARIIQMDKKFQYQCTGQNCENSPFRFQEYCLSGCPRGYVHIKNGLNSTCKFCNITEFYIPNEPRTECVCAKQYFFNQKSGNCQPCHYSCLICNNDKTCLSCDTADKTTKRVMNRQSTCSCTDGFFDNLEKKTLTCDKCHNSCFTCSGPSQYQCTSCQSGRSKDSTNRCACGENFSDKQGKCICQEPNSLRQGVCYGTTVGQNLCNIPNSIQVIAKNGKAQCQCKEGFTMFKDSCLSCPQTFVLNKKNGTCECSKTSFLNSKGICVECGPLKQFDERFEKCFCKKQYFETANGQCIDCPPKSTYENGKCQCVFNYYLKNGVCVKCKKTEDDANCNRVQLSQL